MNRTMNKKLQQLESRHREIAARYGHLRLLVSSIKYLSENNSPEGIHLVNTQ